MFERIMFSPVFWFSGSKPSQVRRLGRRFGRGGLVRESALRCVRRKDMLEFEEFRFPNCVFYYLFIYFYLCLIVLAFLAIFWCFIVYFCSYFHRTLCSFFLCITFFFIFVDFVLLMHFLLLLLSVLPFFLPFFITSSVSFSFFFFL